MKYAISPPIDPDDIIELLADAIHGQSCNGYENEIGKAHACLTALGKEGYKITNANAIEVETKKLQDQAFGRGQAYALKELHKNRNK